ncbi:tripartite tricarboxylate transporter substrate binding protein [Roseococcus sp. SYP-B2431]|uniref:Bug family tripartite tricarboxylate transporter substrate binding protein n=1 Tax=Roseococcus sp. SYP-B2431 TaxID=2496640 RepID=UPI00103C1F19|nr:tripartite tricarboxylate transporter substrate binding protein [Roseococcus sp. SYP-B2431]TCH99820.1 tripartite tricarboxylate transporter substrate binding protein [Roseococcus sp. SYP-B2431]
MISVKTGRRAALALTTAGLASPALCPSARAQTRPPFPTRPIRIFGAWAPGPNVYTRVLADLMAPRLGQPIVIESKAGANGTLAARALATEAPDGHSLAQMPGSVFRVPFMSPRPPYDPLADFSYIICLTGYPFGVVVNANSPYRSWADLVAAAKRRPGAISYGSPGAGTEPHVVMDRIAELEGIEWLHAPYRGGSELTSALLSGTIDAVATASHWSQLVLDGRFRLLNVWTPERIARYPDAPTLKELGYGIVATSPYGIAGPKGMDPGVVRQLHDAFKEALFRPESLSYLAGLDQPVMYMDSEAYTDFARRQVAQERELVRRLNLRME